VNSSMFLVLNEQSDVNYKITKMEMIHAGVNSSFCVKTCLFFKSIGYSF
jgi:hypothetical protein